MGHWPEKICPEKRLCPSVNILVANRLVYVEASAFLYAHSQFNFKLQGGPFAYLTPDSFHSLYGDALNIRTLSKVHITVAAASKDFKDINNLEIPSRLDKLLTLLVSATSPVSPLSSIVAYRKEIPTFRSSLRVELDFDSCLGLEIQSSDWIEPLAKLKKAFRTVTVQLTFKPPSRTLNRRFPASTSLNRELQFFAESSLQHLLWLLEDELGAVSLVGMKTHEPWGVEVEAELNSQQ